MRAMIVAAMLGLSFLAGCDNKDPEPAAANTGSPQEPAVANYTPNADQPASPPVILGVEVGSQTTLPTCRLSKHEFAVDEYSIKTACRKLNEVAGSGSYWDIYIPNKDKPNYVYSMRVLVLDNLVAEAQIVTTGIQSQDAVMSDLTTKFGAPSSQSTDLMNNAFGAQFDVTRASWSLGKGISLSFIGADKRVDYGRISVITEKAWRWSPPSEATAHL